jgi:cell filamentation protein
MYGTFADPYCYPGTTVLKNIPGLRDAEALERYELSFSDQRAREPLPAGRFTVRHYRSIHWHLFRDVYSWAGRFRTVRMAREQSVFCYPENIASEIKRVFVEIKSVHFLRGLNEKAFAVSAAHVLSELNAIHPFREGNGRTQLVFLAALADQASHPLDLRRLDREAYLSGIIRSFKGDERALAVQLLRLVV